MRQSANTLQRTSAISSSAVSGIPDLILRNVPARTSVPRTTDNGRSDFSAYISVRFLPILTKAADSIFGSDTSRTAEDLDYVPSANGTSSHPAYKYQYGRPSAHARRTVRALHIPAFRDKTYLQYLSL